MSNEDWQATLGVIILAVAAGLLWVLGTFWYVLIPAGVGLTWYIGHRNSPATKERAAKALNEQLYQDALARLQPTRAQHGAEGFAERILQALPNRSMIPDAVLEAIIHCCFELYALEPFEPDDIPKPPPLANSMEGARYRDRINALVQKFDNGAARNAAEHAIARGFGQFIARLPLTSAQGDLLATLPLAQSGDVRAAIDALSSGFFDEAIIEHRLFSDLRGRLNRNVYEVSGYDIDTDDPRNEQLTFVEDYAGKEDVAETYLKHTPLLPILRAPVEFRIPEHIRYEHTAIVGGSGHGKTSLLQHLILGDLEKAANGGGGFAVIDPKGTLIDLIAQQRCFSPDSGGLSKRIVIIDPKRDLDYPPALNMFDLGTHAQSGLSQADRMSVRNNALDLIDYMFSDLFVARQSG